VIPPGGNEGERGTNVKDPHWLVAVNAVSLILALAANMALLLNMARRLSFKVAQSITIIGWYIASFLLIALIVTSTYSLKLAPGENRALTQAFYYAIIAAALYFIIATLMMFTVYGGLRGEYPMEFKLTTSQRTLMLQTISFMVYMVGGGAVYAKIEGWKFLDGVYFANFTLLTIGIGDYTPGTHLGRSLLFPYAVGGIVILGLVIGSIRSLVLERGKKKLGIRMVEKKREKLLQELYRKEGKDGAKSLIPLSGREDFIEAGMSERERRKKEFHLMRKIQDQASRRQKWNALLISGGAWFTLWFIGAVVFWRAERHQGWEYFEALYFAYTTLLTIGYGDLRPYSNAGKVFFVFWSLLAVPTLTIVISNMGDTVVKSVRDLTLYLGDITVLPGERSTKERLRKGVSKFTQDKARVPFMNEPSGVLAEKGGDDTEKQNRGAQIAATDRMAGDIEQTELNEAEAAKDRGDKLGEDIHEYHYLLIKEFRNVLKHLNESPPRRYSYEEWAWFLKLIGEDENSDASHRKAPVKVLGGDDNGPDTQQGQSDGKDKEARQWSWLGNRSPLMGELEEAEWILERLSMTLEKEMKKKSEARSSEQASSAEMPEAKLHSSSGSSGLLDKDRLGVPKEATESA